jgi:hypothetical protein
MPEKDSEQYKREITLAKLLTANEMLSTPETSSQTLAWATQCLAALLRTDSSTSSMEVSVLCEVIEEEVRWLKRKNDQSDQRRNNPIEVATVHTIKAPPPSKLPDVTLKILRRAGFRYSASQQTWSTWKSDESVAAAAAVAEQGQLFDA